MPKLIENTDFNFGKEDYNKNFVSFLYKDKNKKILKEDDNFILFISEDDNLKQNFAILLDKKTELMDYYSRYVKIDINSVSQIMFWSRKSSKYTKGIPEYILYNYYLSKWKCIVSGEFQTPDGRKFWERNLLSSLDKNFKIGFKNTKEKEIDWFNDDRKNLSKWIKSKNAWGKDDNFKNLAFIISV